MSFKFIFMSIFTNKELPFENTLKHEIKSSPLINYLNPSFVIKLINLIPDCKRSNLKIRKMLCWEIFCNTYISNIQNIKILTFDISYCITLHLLFFSANICIHILSIFVNFILQLE